MRGVHKTKASRIAALKRRGSHMSTVENKTDPNLVELIDQLKAKSRDTGSALWRDVALRLSKSRKNWAQPNLSRVSRHQPEDKGTVVLVPGKLLGSGEVVGSPTIAAYSASEGAKAKVEAAGGKVITLAQLMNENPNGKGVVILG